MNNSDSAEFEWLNHIHYTAFRLVSMCDEGGGGGAKSPYMQDTQANNSHLILDLTFLCRSDVQ